MPRAARISFELLETFVTLIDAEGDAAQAARELEINQPSMSKRLATLQHANETISKPWLQRFGKQWQLTETGKQFLPAARELVSRMQALREASNHDHRLAPDVSIGCGEDVIDALVMPALEDFLRELPKCTYRVSVMSGADRIQQVANGTLNMATVTHSDDDILEEAGRELCVENLKHDPLVLVLGRSAPKEVRDRFRLLPDPITNLGLLDNLPLILPAPEGGTRTRIDDALRKADGLNNIKVVLELEGWQTILNYVRHGHGLGIVIRSAVSDKRELLPPKSFDEELLAPTITKLICRYRASEPSALDLSPAAETLRTLLKSRAKKS